MKDLLEEHVTTKKVPEAVTPRISPNEIAKFACISEAGQSKSSFEMDVKFIREKEFGQ